MSALLFIMLSFPLLILLRRNLWKWICACSVKWGCGCSVTPVYARRCRLVVEGLQECSLDRSSGSKAVRATHPAVPKREEGRAQRDNRAQLQVAGNSDDRSSAKSAEICFNARRRLPSHTASVRTWPWGRGLPKYSRISSEA